MKKTIKLSIIAIGILTLIGCSAPEVIVDQNGGKISSVQTNYSESLEEANTMISVFYGEPIHVFIPAITDKTNSGGKLPRDISTIVRSSFNSVGEKVITMMNYNPKKLPKGATFKILGAITEFDLIEVEASGSDAAGQGTINGQQGTADASLDQASKISKLGITFNPANSKTGNFIPKTSTKNKITITQKSASNEFAVSILGTGVGVNHAVTKSQGIHSSITILIELSVVEVLGRLTRYPYWLLTGGKVNSDILNELSRKFVRGTLNQKIQKVSYLLSLNGANVQTTSMMNPTLKSAIIKYKQAHGMGADDSIDNKLYLSLLGS